LRNDPSSAEAARAPSSVSQRFDAQYEAERNWRCEAHQTWQYHSRKCVAGGSVYHMCSQARARLRAVP
jgi:hypothetical protein